MRFRDGLDPHSLSRLTAQGQTPLVTSREERPKKSRFDFEYRGGCEFTDALQQAYDQLIGAGFCAACKGQP